MDRPLCRLALTMELRGPRKCWRGGGSLCLIQTVQRNTAWIISEEREIEEGNGDG